MVTPKSWDEAQGGEKKQNTWEEFCSERGSERKYLLLSSRGYFPLKTEGGDYSMLGYTIKVKKKNVDFDPTILCLRIYFIDILA